MAHSGEELMRVYFIISFYFLLSIHFVLLLLSSSFSASSSSASSSCFSFFFLFFLGVGCHFGRRGKLPFLAGEVNCLFWQEVGCLFGRIFLRGGDIACMYEGCSGGVFVVCQNVCKMSGRQFSSKMDI